MTNNQSNGNGGGRRNTHVNQGTPIPTLESNKVDASVDDIKDAMFMYLQFAKSKFWPSEQLSLEGGRIVVHGTMKPAEINTQRQFNVMNFTEKKTWEVRLKLWNIKKNKVLDSMCRLYPYLGNQCTLLLKSRIKSYPKHGVAKKIKDTVQLWLLIEEVCTNTSAINLVM